MWFAEDLGAVGRRHRSCEDLELVVRCQAAGLEVLVVPDAAVERAIHPADVRARAMLGTAFWHGVSMRRLTGRHPPDLGADYYERRMHARRQARNHVQSLERLGYKAGGPALQRQWPRSARQWSRSAPLPPARSPAGPADLRSQSWRPGAVPECGVDAG
jgi:hypothetical protein